MSNEAGRRGSVMSVLVNYALAAATTALAVMMRLALDPVMLDRLPFALPLLCVMMLAWLLPLGPAIFAAVLGAIGSAYIASPRHHVPAEEPLAPMLEVGLFLVLSGLSLALTSMARSANRRARFQAQLAQDTARQLVLDRQRASELGARWSAVVQNSDDAIMAKDAHGIIRECNPAVERIFGYSASELIGRHITALIPPDLHDEEARIMSSLRRGEHIDHYETYRVRKNGERFPVSLSISPIRDAEGNFVGAAKILRDVSRRKHDEQALIRSEAALVAAQALLLAREQEEKKRIEIELERARDQLLRQARLAAIGQVSASIAHDLRNPLTTILNSAYLLRRKFGGVAEAGPILTMIEDEVRTSDRIISNLLEMTRTRSLSKEAVNLPEFVQEVVQRCDVPAGLQWSCEIPQSLMVWADRAQLRQLLHNLIVNAVQAAGENGRLCVHAYQQNGSHLIEVQDSGPGVDPAIRDRLFEPLVTTKAKGTGLGLAICRQIAERHGGQIDVVRSDAAGTRFRVVLPAQGGNQE